MEKNHWEFLLVLLGIALLLQWRQPPRPGWHKPLWLLGIGLFAMAAVALQWQFGQYNVYSSRNFYGSLVVRDLHINGQLQRQLIDGTTSHGAQYLDPVLAQHFREALRTARDRSSMLDVGDAMFEEVALAAGAERAASLRERLEQLLPRAPEATPGAYAVTQPALLEG